MALVKPTDSRCTPDWLFKALDMEFAFDLDPCPFQPGWDAAVHQDGLQLDWERKRVFCNPPWSCIKPWVEKALDSQSLTVFVLPVRTDTSWFQLLVNHRAEFRWFARRVFFVATPSAPVDSHAAHANGGTVVAVINNLTAKGKNFED